ncbi:hypothetical protein EG19_04040 [Thermoanaerobaculum aquaticum]|uniref:Uncharacterized protein n=1 Tax=Thermoanaerobaculum aquaticum TaxID=1312852 RepID=A0A062XQV4_9BACT|nr:hypothetical protein EG19_04040 [Thermoanaerobaculum aquaticum]
MEAAAHQRLWATPQTTAAPRTTCGGFSCSSRSLTRKATDSAPARAENQWQARMGSCGTSCSQSQAKTVQPGWSPGFKEGK